MFVSPVVWAIPLELLPPAYVVRREGTVFTGVCLSTGRGVRQPTQQGEGGQSGRGGQVQPAGGWVGQVQPVGGGQWSVPGGVRSSQWGGVQVQLTGGQVQLAGGWGGSGPASGRGGQVQPVGEGGQPR